METLKNISFSKGFNNYNVAFVLTGGGANLTVWEGDSAGIVIGKLETLVANLKAGVLERALQ